MSAHKAMLQLHIPCSHHQINALTATALRAVRDKGHTLYLQLTSPLQVMKPFGVEVRCIPVNACFESRPCSRGQSPSSIVVQAATGAHRDPILLHHSRKYSAARQHYTIPLALTASCSAEPKTAACSAELISENTCYRASMH